MGLFYEASKSIHDLLDEKNNFVFIGESGSGKSEIALNIALLLADRKVRAVDLFDLDQTKPLFRSRDMKEQFLSKGVSIHYQKQFLDAPVMVGGVRASLTSDNYTLLDIGGGHQAAKFAGAYADLLTKDDTVPIYVFNPYRPWSGNIESIDATMMHILGSMRLDHIYLLANPNLGYETSIKEFNEGISIADELFKEYTNINSACVRFDLYEQVKNMTDKCLIPLELFLSHSQDFMD